MAGYPNQASVAGPSDYYGRPGLPTPAPHLSHQHPFLEPIPEPTAKAGYEAPVFRTFQDRRRARPISTSSLGENAVGAPMSHSRRPLPPPRPSAAPPFDAAANNDLYSHPSVIRTPGVITPPASSGLSRAPLPNPPLHPTSNLSRTVASPSISASAPVSTAETALERSDTVSSVKSLDRIAFGSRRPLPRPPGGINSSKSLDRGLPVRGVKTRRQPSIVDEEDEEIVPSITVDSGASVQDPKALPPTLTEIVPSITVDSGASSQDPKALLPPTLTFSGSPSNEESLAGPRPPVGIIVAEPKIAEPPAPLDANSAIICTGCNLQIIGRIVNAIQQRWHPHCFKCYQCGELLEHVSSYEWNGKPYCHLDYHDNFAPRCFHCKTPIVDARFVTLNDPTLGERYYHELHFFCCECGDPFLDPSQSSAPGAHASEEETNAFVIQNGYPYCERCHIRLHKPKCRACSKPIPDIAIEAMGSKWHQKCFTCSACGHEFANGLFFPKDGEAFCLSCYEQVL